MIPGETSTRLLQSDINPPQAACQNQVGRLSSVLMIPPDRNPTILWGDPEHAGIRLLLMPLLITGFLVGFFLARVVLAWIIPGNEFLTAFACVGGLPLGLGLAYVGESLLKRFWRSGRAVVIEDAGISLQVNNQIARRFQAQSNLNLVKWSFPLSAYPRGGRERRAPRQWLCLGCQLRQEEARLVVYAFLSPKEAAPLIAAYGFHAIDPADVYDTSLAGRLTQPASRPAIPAAVLAGKEGVYWAAERQRWQEGVELTPADFARLMAHVERMAEERVVDS